MFNPIEIFWALTPEQFWGNFKGEEHRVNNTIRAKVESSKRVIMVESDRFQEGEMPEENVEVLRRLFGGEPFLSVQRNVDTDEISGYTYQAVIDLNDLSEAKSAGFHARPIRY